MILSLFLIFVFCLVLSYSIGQLCLTFCRWCLLVSFDVCEVICVMDTKAQTKSPWIARTAMDLAKDAVTCAN